MTGFTLTSSLPLLDPATVRREVLPNGLTVLVRRDESAPVVAVNTYVKAGYFDETDDIVGLAHVLEHMYFKGTATRGVGEIAKATKASGGYLNAHTIYDHTSYYTVLPATGFAAGLDIQADAYAHSVLAAEELAKELEVIIQEAKRKADNPSAVATETLYELLFDVHRIRRWRIGREPQLRAYARPVLERFYRNFYRPGNTILAIVGDVDPDEALRLAEQRYGAIPDAQVERAPGPEEPEHHEFRFREWAGDITQTQLVLGWRTPGTLDPDTPFLDLAAAVLGSGRASRLYRAVRERQLAASITAYDYTPVDVGVFVIHAETPPERTTDAARAAWAQLRDLRETGPGEAELRRAIRLFESRWVRRLETMEGQASYLAEWEALGDWQLGERYLERLVTATREQVTTAVARWLPPDDAGVVIYAPRAAAPVAPDADAMRRLLDEGTVPPLPVVPPEQAEGAPAVVASPPLEYEEAGVRVYRTPRGVPILVRLKRGAPIAYMGVYALGGALDETERDAGITTLLGRTALKGTERRTAAQIAEDAELLGGSISAGAGSDSFGWSISVPTKYTMGALELLGDVVQHATIPDDRFETERELLLADLELLRDDMYRWPMRLMTEAAFAGHPYGIPATGTEQSLPQLTAELVRTWHRHQVLEGATVIAIVGDVDPDEMAAVAARAFGDLTHAPTRPVGPPRWPTEVTHNVESRQKAQTALAMAYPGPSRTDPDRFPAELLAVVASGLGGRFFDELRDRQSLCYTVHAFPSERRLAGMFVSYIATSPEKEDIARAGLLQQFARLREEPVTDAEMTRARTYALGTHAIRQQSGGSVLGDVVDAWLFGEGLRELDEYEARVRAVTPASIQALAERWFDDARRVEGIVRGVGRTV